MRKYFLLVAIAGIVAGGCKKHADHSAPPIVQGNINVRFYTPVTIKQAFDLVDSLGFPVRKVSGFPQMSDWPTDSLSQVKTLLYSQTYVDSTIRIRLGTVANNREIISVSMSLHDMTRADEQDILALMSRMKLEDLNDTVKVIQIGVPDGEELMWMNNLSRHPKVAQTFPTYAP